MLDIAKLESGKMGINEEPVEMRKFFKDLCLDMKQISKTKSQDIEMTIDYDETVVITDAAKLRQIFINLMGNAVKFTPEKGSIRIRSFMEDSMIVTTITDTGIGIARENIERIFDKFVQVKNNATKNVTGTGL